MCVQRRPLRTYGVAVIRCLRARRSPVIFSEGTYEMVAHKPQERGPHVY